MNKNGAMVIDVANIPIYMYLSVFSLPKFKIYYFTKLLLHQSFVLSICHVVKDQLYIRRNFQIKIVILFHNIQGVDLISYCVYVSCDDCAHQGL